MQKTYNLKVIKEVLEINNLTDVEKKNNGNNTIWNTLKENSTILLLYFFVWIEFVQVVYLYETLKKLKI